MCTEGQRVGVMAAGRVGADEGSGGVWEEEGRRLGLDWGTNVCFCIRATSDNGKWMKHNDKLKYKQLRREGSQA